MCPSDDGVRGRPASSLPCSPASSSTMRHSLSLTGLHGKARVIDERHADEARLALISPQGHLFLSAFTARTSNIPEFAGFVGVVRV